MVPKVTIQYNLDNDDELDNSYEEKRKLMIALQAGELQYALDDFTRRLRRISKNGLIADGIPYNIYADNLPVTLVDTEFRQERGVPQEEYGKLLAREMDGDTMTDCIADLFFEIMKENNINLGD